MPIHCREVSAYQWFACLRSAIGQLTQPDALLLFWQLRRLVRLYDIFASHPRFFSQATMKRTRRIMPKIPCVRLNVPAGNLKSTIT